MYKAVPGEQNQGASFLLGSGQSKAWHPYWFSHLARLLHWPVLFPFLHIVVNILPFFELKILHFSQFLFQLTDYLQMCFLNKKYLGILHIFLILISDYFMVRTLFCTIWIYLNLFRFALWHKIQYILDMCATEKTILVMSSVLFAVY